MSNKLNTLVGIMEVKFLQKQINFAKITAEENRLRGELAKVDRMAADARTDDDTNRKAIGADVIWNAWVGKTKTELNRELALILAQKDKMLGSVRREFGKLVSAEELLAHHSNWVQKQRHARGLSDAIEQHISKK